LSIHLSTTRDVAWGFFLSYHQPYRQVSRG
jgi:hypothetical protein